MHTPDRRPPWTVPTWLAPRDPRLGPLVAAALLACGALLDLTLMLLLPALGGTAPGFGWVVLVLLVVNGLVCATAPRGSATSQLSVVAGALTAIVACASMWGLLYGELDAGVSLMGLPAVFAASQLRRPLAIALTGLTCLSAVTVLALVAPWTAFRTVDAVMVCGSLTLLCGATLHYVEDTRRLLDRLERLAAVDGLTGLVTRRVLDDALATALTSAGAQTGTALVLVDVDSFKTVNDRYGHPVGDAALQHVGAVLTAAVRSTDAVVSRLGGDELAVLLPGCATDVARARAQDLVLAVRAAPLLLADGSPLPITVSVGVAHAPTHAPDVRALYAAADGALYAAKRGGRDRSEVAEVAVLS